MGTYVIKIPCGTDPFPNFFCLCWDSSSCLTLCGQYDPVACDN